MLDAYSENNRELPTWLCGTDYSLKISSFQQPLSVTVASLSPTMVWIQRGMLPVNRKLVSVRSALIAAREL